ncbi:MAG: ceramidase domain-containing protein [Steroidobacteraceae bacterium]
MRVLYKNLLIGAVAAAAIAGTFLLEPIPQDPAYHEFADRRELMGVANFWNVATNLPFLFIGVAGLMRLRRLASPSLCLHYSVFCIAVALVAFGSAYYHGDPSTAALIWDRLPMTVAFMALFSAVIADRVSWLIGRALLWPLVALGVASIAWWVRTEAAGQGDLRLYAIVQFLPLLLMPLILSMSSGAGIASRWLWAAIGAYASAKLVEHFDAAILDATGALSGHSLKHLLAALAVWWIIRSFQRSPASAL